MLNRDAGFHGDGAANRHTQRGPVPTDTLLPSETPGVQNTPTPTETTTPSITPTETETPTPSFTPSNTSSLPTPTTISTEPAPEPLELARYPYDGDGILMKGIVETQCVSLSECEVFVVNDTVTYYPGRHYNKEVKGTVEKAQKFYSAAGQTVAVRTIQDGQDTLTWMLCNRK